MTVSPRALLACGAALAAGAWAAIAFTGAAPSQAPVRFAALYALAFAGYALGLGAVLGPGRTRALAVIVGVGAALRVLAFPLAPSDDVSRYLFEGRAQVAGLNPYLESPAALAAHPELAGDPQRAAVNHPSWTAIYPPGMLLWHRAVAAVAYHPHALKASFLAAEAALLAVLLALLRARRVAPERVLVYWWSPLPVAAIALEGHHTPVYLALLLGALLLATRSGRVARDAVAAAAALAVLAKTFAVAALPAVAGRITRRGALAALALVALACVPFAGAGAELFRSLLRFGVELHSNDSLHALASFGLGAAGIGDPAASRIAMGCAWLAFAAWVTLRTPDDPVRRAALLLGALLLVLPTVHPWYVVAVVPFLCFFPWPGWLAFTCTCALAYLPYLSLQQTGSWHESTLIRVVEYAPLYAWLGWTQRGRLEALARGFAARAGARP